MTLCWTRTNANDVLIAKSTYTIDDYTTVPMEDYGGTADPPGHISSYDDTVTVRGNVTGATTYTDVGAGTSVTWLSKFDIFGNVIERQLSCCNVKTVTFGDQNAYALPESVTEGASGGPQTTTSTSYDFNTSLVMDTTDPNGMTTEITTRDEQLRPTLITYPTGATASASYNDAAQSSSQSVSYDDGGTQRTVGGSTVYDGLGRVIQQVDANGGQVNTSYDVMGRVISVTNPFTAGGSPGPSTSYTYDDLGRATVVTLPDSQTIQTSIMATQSRLPIRSTERSNE